MRRYRQCIITEDNFTFLRTRRYRSLHCTYLVVLVQCVTMTFRPHVFISTKLEWGE